MTVTSIVAVLALHTGKIIKERPQVFLKEEKMCYKMVTTLVFTLSQSSEIVLQS